MYIFLSWHVLRTSQSVSECCCSAVSKIETKQLEDGTSRGCLRPLHATPQPPHDQR